MLDAIMYPLGSFYVNEAPLCCKLIANMTKTMLVVVAAVPRDWGHSLNETMLAKMLASNPMSRKLFVLTILTTAFRYHFSS